MIEGSDCVMYNRLGFGARRGGMVSASDKYEPSGDRSTMGFFLARKCRVRVRHRSLRDPSQSSRWHCALHLLEACRVDSPLAQSRIVTNTSSLLLMEMAVRNDARLSSAADNVSKLLTVQYLFLDQHWNYQLNATPLANPWSY